MSDDICLHEAGHVTMALTLSANVDAAVVGNFGGYVKVGHRTHNPTDCVKHLLIALGGLIESAATGDDLPSWPVDPARAPAGEESDWAQIRDIGEWLSLDSRTYERLLAAALTVSASSDYQALLGSITGQLDYRPTLSRDDIRMIVDMTDMRRRHG